MIPLLEQFPNGRLDPAQETALAVRIQRGDIDAQNELVLSVMRQAVLYTARTSRGAVPDGERISLCYQRLMRAAKRFNPARGGFFPFAKAALRGLMKTYWEDQGVVRNAAEIIPIDLLGGSGVDPQDTGGPPPPRALPRERITGEVAEPDTDAICARDEWEELSKRSSHRLNARHRMVLSLMYRGGLNGPEIGALMGVTRSRVHAIHREAIQIIRDVTPRGGRLLSKA